MKWSFTASVVEGPRLRLRPVSEEDAPYIHSLRTNPSYNRHLSAVNGTVEDQRNWIEHYQRRASEGIEIYYIIERRDTSRPCGTVRLYEIEGSRFTWGSWILDGTKTSKAALESAVLSFGVGFFYLGKDLAQLDVRIDNVKADNFYRRLGMLEFHRDARNIFYTYCRSRLKADLRSYMDIVEGG